MRQKRGIRRWGLLLLLLFAAALCWVAPLGAAPRQASAGSFAHAPNSLQAAFAAAAREFGVPERVLLAVSYNVSRWEQHGGAPSTWGGYGVMHLRHLDAAPRIDGKGDGVVRTPRIDPSHPALHTLDTAAKLLGLSPDVLKRDVVQNIRGGAALLAQYAHEITGTQPANEADWYGAVAKYSGSQDAAVALDFANAVYTTIQQGAARTTSAGQQVALAPANVAPNRSTAAPLNLRPSKKGVGLECPDKLDCEFIPAAYSLNNPADLSDYGNYDLANRPYDGLKIRYVVIHDTEVDYNTTLQIFQNPLNYVSSHYVLRASDGHIAQMVENKNVAWHAGNWYVNGHAIGLEHEGFAIEGATWYSEQMYRASAKLVRYLAEKYHIPLDRAHIVGHDDIPGPTPPFQAGMHWDPGPFWDWAHYMDLIGAPIKRSGDDGSRVVTINPDFETNRQPLTYCYTADDCREVPAQPSNFVYLHTAPSLDAPYVSNPYIDDEPTHANNWANKAVTGQQFYRAGHQGDWDAIYFSGQVAWFYNPHRKNTVRGSGMLITPKAGRVSIPVYGRAYPEAAAYPSGTTPQSIVPIYEMPAGQIYVAAQRIKGDYYWAPTYAPTLEESDHVVVGGETKYYQIFFNHRFAFVMASDVDVIAGD
jgi:N-acetyl-anhydromuramyl-L-alanine amidase AmpD